MKSLAVGLLLIFVIADSAEADALQKFDLICTGSLHKWEMLSGDKATSSWSGIIRVDLDSNLFCMDDCKATDRIVDVGPEELVLVFQKGDNDRDEDVARVSRKTGEYNRHFHLTDPFHSPPQVRDETYQAVCTLAPFTEFSRTLF